MPLPHFQAPLLSPFLQHQLLLHSTSTTFLHLHDLRSLRNTTTLPRRSPPSHYSVTGRSLTLRFSTLLPCPSSPSLPYFHPLYNTSSTPTPLPTLPLTLPPTLQLFLHSTSTTFLHLHNLQSLCNTTTDSISLPRQSPPPFTA